MITIMLVMALTVIVLFIYCIATVVGPAILLLLIPVALDVLLFKGISYLLKKKKGGK